MVRNGTKEIAEGQGRRLSLLIGGLGGGGAQGVCVTLANALVARGHSVEIAVLDLRSAKRLDEVDDSVAVVDLQAGRARYAWWPLVRHYRTSCYDVVLVFSPELWLLMAGIRWRTRGSYRLLTRTINTFGAVARYSPSLLRRTVVDWLLRLFYRRAEGVIAQSAAMAAELIVVYRVPPERLHVIPNPVSPSYLAVDGNTPRPMESPYILYVGRLAFQKGLGRLLCAFAEHAAQRTELQLVLLGEGPCRDELVKQATALGIDGQVHFLGHQGEVMPWYRHAVTTVLTSRYEGLPNVLIESIACGTPVVSFDCPSGPSEIIVDGENGYLVLEGDVAGLVRALASIEQGDFDRERVRATAKRYSPERVVSDYERVLFDLTYASDQLTRVTTDMRNEQEK